MNIQEVFDTVDSIKQEIIDLRRDFHMPPEEEGPNSGAENMVADGVMEDVNAIFGLHLTTEYPTGMVTIKKGAAMASSDDFEIEMIGKGGHASMPHEYIDAISMAVKVYNDIQFMVSREFDPIEPIIVSVGAFNSGAASNVIQGSAKLKGTIRTLSHEVRDKVKRRICEIVKHVGEESGGKYKINMIPGVPPLMNDIDKATFAEKAVEKVVEKENVLILDRPNMGSEDFAYYLEKVPGVMMMIGARNEEKGFVHLMHHPEFDFDEEAPSIALCTGCF